MQSFFNPKTPFFDGEGHLLTNARVTFRAAGTSGEKITLRNIDGITLENPLFTGMDGKFKAEEFSPGSKKAPIRSPLLRYLILCGMAND